MNRTELLKSTAYWTQMLQLDVLELVNGYMKKHNMSPAQFAQHLGVSKGYVSQLLNGNFDHRISKLVELALACESVPSLSFENAENAEKVVASYRMEPIKWSKRLEYVKPAMSLVPKKFKYSGCMQFTKETVEDGNVNIVA